jgi:hypothetical protein
LGQFVLLQARQTKSNISKRPANSKIQKKIKIARLCHSQNWGNPKSATRDIAVPK